MLGGELYRNGAGSVFRSVFYGDHLEPVERRATFFWLGQRGQDGLHGRTQVLLFLVGRKDHRKTRHNDRSYATDHCAPTHPISTRHVRERIYDWDMSDRPSRILLPRRWPIMSRLSRPIVIMVALTFGMGACSSNPQNQVDPNKTPPPVVATAAATAGAAAPNGSAGISTTTSPAPASTFASRLIETPSELINATRAHSLPADATVTPSEFSIVATATVPRIEIYATATDTVAKATLSNPLPDGHTPLTLLVDAQTSKRAKVLLPVPPNGSTGWVDLSQLQTARNDYRIEVSLAKHELVVRHGGDVIMTEQVGVGATATPTPKGRFYVKALLKPPNQNTVYGHYAYPLSGQSETLKEWQGGEPTLGLHGTNDPGASLGKDVSHGCIRMSNDAIDTLAKILPLGTPLVVAA